MSRWNAVKKTYAMCCRLRDQRGGSVWRYFPDALHCSYRHGASPENYFVLRFYALSDRERADYLTSGRSAEADRALNRNATRAEQQIIGRKNLFCKTFSDLIHRECVYAPECEFERFNAFLDRNREFIVKPAGGSMGRGIEKRSAVHVEDWPGFYRLCRDRELLLESLIPQHSELERISPGCVNSVRINAARAADGTVRLIGGCLKCGGAGAVTDNFHTGGIAYPIDLRTGRVSGPGRNNTEIRDYTRHPGSQVYMPGFQVPFWDAVIACVQRAMDVLPGLGYVGWDIAVMPDGPELIEGNYRWPGGNIIQLDGVGKYPLLKACLGDGYEKKHTD